MRKLPDPTGQLRCVPLQSPRRNDGEIRGISPGEKRREGRRRATCGGDGAQRDAAHQPDQEDEREITTSPAPPGDDEPVPGGTAHSRTQGQTCPSPPGLSEVHRLMCPV